MERAVPWVAMVMFAWLLAGLAQADAPLAIKLVMGLPLCVVISIAVLAIRYPAGSDPARPFWKRRESGIPTPNLEHPAAKYALGFWAALALVWLAAMVWVARGRS
jgi:hypothetical protein